MANLLSKFRIDYGDVTVIPDVIRKAAGSSQTEFEALIEEFKTKDQIGDGKSNNSWYWKLDILNMEYTIIEVVRTTMRKLFTKFPSSTRFKIVFKFVIFN